MRRWILWMVLAGALLGAVVSQVAWGAPAAQSAPPVPHPTAGREACLTCHSSGNQAVPADHAGRGEGSCLVCHTVAEAAAPEATAETATTPVVTATSPVTTVVPTSVLVPTVENVLPPTPTVTLPPISPQDYKGPEFCAQCHKPHLQEWQNSTHAQAFNDPAFQSAWVENRKPGYCLQCHATGYNPNTGQPIAEGVTCESCHGTYREGHPQTDMMPIDPAAEKCGSCHVTTYQEWQLSGHSQRGVKCASCHAVHSQGLLFDTSNALCATCHGDLSSDFAHAAHAQNGVTCADCHMYKPAGTTPNEGLAPTGHFFTVESQACTQCHTRDSIHSRRQEFAPATQPDATTMQRLTTLQTDFNQLKETSNRNVLLGLGGGGLGGLLVGVVISVVLQRRNGGGKREPQDHA